MEKQVPEEVMAEKRLASSASPGRKAARAGKAGREKKPGEKGAGRAARTTTGDNGRSGSAGKARGGGASGRTTKRGKVGKTTPPRSRRRKAESGRLGTLHREVRLLYTGRSRRARMFRYGLIAFDLLTIGYFLVVSFIHEAPWMRVADFVFAALIAVDFAARLWIAENRWAFLRQLPTLADIVVIVSLAGTFVFENLAYLRILRALRLVRSYHVLNDLRELSPVFRRNEHIIIAATNLLVFVFVVSALVYTLQAPVNPAIANYIDALYFTVTTLTTTGFGDIVLTGTGGRLLAVGIMVFGAALFLRLAQAIFRPPRVRHRCPQCGLLEHDSDASHCKHCGHVLNIPTEGL